MSSQESYLDALKRVIDEVVAPGAASGTPTARSRGRSSTRSARPGSSR